MKKIKYSFWDNESKEVIYEDFFAVGFSCSIAGVCFALDYFMDNIFWSWDEIKAVVGADVIFTVAAD